MFNRVNCPFLILNFVLEFEVVGTFSFLMRVFHGDVRKETNLIWNNDSAIRMNRISFLCGKIVEKTCGFAFGRAKLRWVDSVRVHSVGVCSGKTPESDVIHFFEFS